MAKKVHRRHSRKSHSKKRHTKKHHKRSHKRSTRRRMTKKNGGAGAPVNYSLAGNWSSRMSLGQGQDFFKYHEGQHGGQAPYPGAVESSSLPANLRGPAHLDGLDKAFVDIAGLKDQTGGKRKAKKHGKKHGKKHTKKHSKKHSKRRTTRRRTHKRKGGSYASVNSPNMLLSDPKAYAQAGLNPEWKTDVAFEDAKLREQA